MPKPVSPPTPAYGSPEWKAMRAKMVGTPEWKEATGYKAPPADSVGPMAQGVYFKAALPFTPAGKILTTAEKQAQSPLYNPLYDPSSTEYKQNLINVSNPNQKPATPQIQIPSAATPKSPVVNTANLTQAYQNQISPVINPTIPLPDIFKQNQNTSPSIYPPSSPQGIKMPTLSKNSGAGSNWSDLLSVAHNRYTR